MMINHGMQWGMFIQIHSSLMMIVYSPFGQYTMSGICRDMVGFFAAAPEVNLYKLCGVLCASWFLWLCKYMGLIFFNRWPAFDNPGSASTVSLDPSTSLGIKRQGYDAFQGPSIFVCFFQAKVSDFKTTCPSSPSLIWLAVWRLVGIPSWQDDDGTPVAPSEQRPPFWLDSTPTSMRQRIKKRMI